MNTRRLFQTIAPALLLGALIYALGASRAATTDTSPSARPPAGGEVSPFEVDGTRIQVRKADGSIAQGDALLGAVLVGRIDGGIRNAFRIDALELDPRDPSGEVVLYSLSTRDPEAGVWKNACTPDAQGIARGFPLAGIWTPSGEHRRTPGHLELACTSGALGKCVRMGYKPWKSEAMWDRHQACVRMVRADYCGDGTGHTRNGTPIDVFDEEGIQADAPAPGMSFEAAWGKDGAVCLSRTRIPEVATPAQMRASCPAKLGRDAGATCSEARARLDPRTLLMNKS
jgi:hypothetical protein